MTDTTTADAPTEAPTQRVDQRVSRHAWQIALWSKASGTLVDGLIASSFEGEKRPMRQDDNWLRVSGQGDAQRLVDAALAYEEGSDNVYHQWLLDLLIAQLLQAFPGVSTPNDRLFLRVSTGLNALREAGIVTDWRAFTPAGPTKCSFRLTLADGSDEEYARPKQAWARVQELTPATEAATV